MKRSGKELVMDKKLFEAIQSYMADSLRETVYREVAPCTPEKFLTEYCRKDPTFEILLMRQFRIELEET